MRTVHTATPSDDGAHLHVDGVSKSYPDRRVLTNVSFSVSAGQRAALIGENGTGKSTLLRVAAGLEAPDAGQIFAPGTVGFFHQQPPFSLDFSINEVLADAASPLHALAAAVTHAGEALAESPDDNALASRLSAALDEAERAGVWDLDHRTDELVDGLGIASLPRDRRAKELSGGQLARLSLAWVLLRRPETLLLDEPTNHLDDRGAALLTRILGEWPGPVLFASHDRAFLDETVTDLIDLDPRPVPHRMARRLTDIADSGAGLGVTRFTGTYSQYVLARADEQERWAAQYAAQQEELTRLRAQVETNHQVGHSNWTPRSETRMAKKFYGDRNATVVSRRVNDARTALERLEESQVRKPPQPLRFIGADATATSAGRGRPPAGPILTATNVEVSGRLNPISLTLSGSDRLLIEGSNGSGKSTLLLALAGTGTPTNGTVTVAPRTSIGLLDQDPQLAPLHNGETAREAYERGIAERSDATTPPSLSTLGLLAGRDENRPLASLSVGQRRRLDLAVLLAAPPDVLLLDEPTNHFSLLLAEDLERSLRGYPGAIVVASHDRMLRARWAWGRITLGDTPPPRRDE